MNCRNCGKKRDYSLDGKIQALCYSCTPRFQRMRPDSCKIIDVRGNVHPGELSRTMGFLFDWMGEYASEYGLDPPIILSACRSLTDQRLMQREWDLGNQEGLAVRPADNSKHIPDEFGYCRAFDLANSEDWLNRVGRDVSYAFQSVEWGGNYLRKDIRHFEERG